MQRLMEVVKERKIEAVLISYPVNMWWVVGYGSPGDLLLIFPRRFIYLALPISYEYAKRKIYGGRVLKYRELTLVRRLLQRMDIKRVVVEAGRVNISQMEKFRTKLRGIKLRPREDLIEDLRAVKDKEEIKRLRKAAGLADRAIAHILPFVKPGVKEKWLADEIDAFIRSEGAEGASFEIAVASGRNTSCAHYKTGNRRLSKNDLVVIDLGCVYKGYCSDLTRTMFLGKITAKQREVYSVVLSAQESALKAIKPGRKCAELDAQARKIIGEAGYGRYFVHNTGHGVGIEIHEKPWLNSQNSTLLKRGMVLTVEPGVYLPGQFGVRIEDMVLVTDRGYEILTHAPKAEF